MHQDIFNIETLGEAMRPESLRGETFRLSREERDYIAGHALGSMDTCAKTLIDCIQEGEGFAQEASSEARKIAALSNLLSDIGWERKASSAGGWELRDEWHLGELFPVAQLRPWLKKWQRQDDEALIQTEQRLEIARLAEDSEIEGELRKEIAGAQTKLGTGAIFLVRLEKGMASHGKLGTFLNALDTSCGPGYEDEVESFLREELETAWIRGFCFGADRLRMGGQMLRERAEAEAVDYAEEVVGGSTRPWRAGPLPTPSKDENSP